jgi:hypothetical protein
MSQRCRFLPFIGGHFIISSQSPASQSRGRTPVASSVCTRSSAIQDRDSSGFRSNNHNRVPSDLFRPREGSRQETKSSALLHQSVLTHPIAPPPERHASPLTPASSTVATGPPATIHAYRAGSKSPFLGSGFANPPQAIGRHSKRGTQRWPDLKIIRPPITMPPGSIPISFAAIR